MQRKKYLLICSICGNRNYSTFLKYTGKVNSIKKYCKHCQKRTGHNVSI